MAINRPKIAYNDGPHVYTAENGEVLLGISTVAKIGSAEDAFSIASAWGWRLGYEGAIEVLGYLPTPWDPEDVREELKRLRKAPWSKRDQAAERGNWTHDVLEALAQDNVVPNLADFPEQVRGHVQSVLRWYLHFRPTFMATEVQVSSERHRFAGRYDLRALIDAKRLLPCIDPLRTDAQAERIRQLAAENKPALGLLDLKTSKRIYPTTHFPQLEGYEGAGIEMGFKETDFRAVINTHESGQFTPETDLAVSWSSYEDFLDYLNAVRAIRRIKNQDPETLRANLVTNTLLEQLPATSRQIADLDLEELSGMDSRSIGRFCGKLRRKGLVEQIDGEWRAVQSVDN